MVDNNEIKKIDTYLKQKANADCAKNALSVSREQVETKPCADASGLKGNGPVSKQSKKLSQSSERSANAHEKEKREMRLWLKSALMQSTDFSTLVVNLLEIKGYKNDYPRFYNKADIDRRLFSKIVASKSNYHPEIKTVFKIIIGLELDLEQANELLQSASYSFGSSMFNLIIQYCVENHVYEHKKIDKYLTEFCGETLYSIK